MKLIRTRDRWLCLAVVVLVVGVDRLSKCLVLGNEFLMDGNSVSAIRGVFSISFAWNTGAAFSFLNGSPHLVTALSALVALALSAVVFLHGSLSRDTRYPMAVVLAGGIGNLLDRFFYGAVADFIRLDFMNFPIFNVADIAVTTGVILFGVLAFFPHGRKEGSR